MTDCLEKDASCWICLGEGPDKSGQSLRRDCSCRGNSAGFVHLACLVDYARHKSMQMGKMCDNILFVDPWRTCPSCSQPYQNRLSLDLKANFVAFVEKEYPGDRSKQLQAVSEKLVTLMNVDTTHPEQKEEVKTLSNKILLMVEEMETLNSSVNIKRIEAEAFHSLGIIALGEGTKESAKLAAEYFQKCRDIFTTNGSADEVIVAEHNLAIAKSKYGRRKLSNDGAIEKWQQCYNNRVHKHGESCQIALESGMQLSCALRRSLRVIEAERLLSKLVDTCKRVHGPDHGLTRQLDGKLNESNMRYVALPWYTARKCGKDHEWKLFHGMKFQSWSYFQALRYTDGGSNCVLRGPVKSFIGSKRNIKLEKTFVVASKDIHILLGTPVVCHGLEVLTHLNGCVGEVRYWGGVFQGGMSRPRIHFEENDLEPLNIKRENLRIVFSLADK
mmetsp:Transcript_25111/g.42913  ORF Transcript_25111/g.42913 Transcript_25111/m.42913 type:complete len:444 (-) Transcript_25111:44-1375(-)|eukprot:CAMPEP_0183717682 /NCGR_PEP_ID=MMETSP0737-20130205/11224_1 /TAXON_ID=385413 /ORGANISM="Thalassiosira miniscula, Strain CCMP1093" /LENGTH=443 /DNA_ID=CAMNT_0025947159 /DNA_START=75 /DNA_END=1406 /DNA_ORIENTATION=-